MRTCVTRLGLRPSLNVKLSALPTKPVAPLVATKLSPPSRARIVRAAVKSVMVALPLKSTRLRKSRNQRLAFKPDVTLTIAFESMAVVVLRRRESAEGRQRYPVRAFRFAALFQLCFNSVSCAKENGFVAESCSGEPLQKINSREISRQCGAHYTSVTRGAGFPPSSSPDAVQVDKRDGGPQAYHSRGNSCASRRIAARTVAASSVLFLIIIGAFASAAKPARTTFAQNPRETMRA